VVRKGGCQVFLSTGREDVSLLSVGGVKTVVLSEGRGRFLSFPSMFRGSREERGEEGKGVWGSPGERTTLKRGRGPYFFSLVFSSH